MKKQETVKTAAGKKNIFLFLSILAVVAVSGCISLGDLFGSGTTTVEASSDVMAVSDSNIIPNPPILTGDTFTTSFAMKNLDEFEDAQNVKVQLYDWGVCTPSSCTPAKSGDTGWDAIDKNKLQTSYSASFGAISPKDVQQVECQFRSPPSEKIGGIDARCPIRYKLTYDFSGITTTDLNIISNKKFQEMSRAGQTPVVTSVQSKSRGPIKVDFSFGVNQPVRTSSADSEIKIPMYIRVENKGSGKTKLNEVVSVPSAKVKINGAEYTLTSTPITVGTDTYSLNNIITSVIVFITVNDEMTFFNNNMQKYVDNENEVFQVKNIDTQKDEIEISYKENSVDKNKIMKINDEITINSNGKNYKLKRFSVDTKVVVINKNSRIYYTFPFSYEDNALLLSIDAGGSLLSGGLVVKVPAALAPSEKCSEISCDSFSSAPEGIDICKLTLTSEADFVKDKSQVFRCELTSPDEDKYKLEHNNQEFEQKVYSIQSEVKYTYQIDNDFNVAIRPMTFG